MAKGVIRNCKSKKDKQQIKKANGQTTIVFMVYIYVDYKY